MYSLNGGHFSDAIITNVMKPLTCLSNETRQCESLFAKTAWILVIANMCSLHITISDEMQSIAIGDIFVLYGPKPLSKG